MSIRTALLALTILAPVFAFAATPATKAPVAVTAKSVPVKPTQTAPAAAAHPADEDNALPQSTVPPFAKVDANGDQKIEWTEAEKSKVPKKTFEKFDFDKSGTLDHTEWLFVRLAMTPYTPPPAVTAKTSSTH